MDAYSRDYCSDPVHKAAASARNKKRYEEKRSEILSHANAYAASHREEYAAYRADPVHKERAVQQAKKYYADPLKRTEYAAVRRASAATEEGKIRNLERRHKYQLAHPEAKRRHRAKRRTLGLIPLNSWFEGSDGHHIDKEYIIYIPKELHQSAHHNVWTGSGMEAINSLVFDWLSKAEQAAA